MSFDKILTTVENTAIALTFLVLTVLAFANVVSRYALHASLSWSTEIIVGLAVYLIMIGTSAAIRSGAHPDFTLLRDASRGPLRQAIILAIGIAMAGFLVLLLWLGLDMATTQLERGRTTPALGIPQWVLSVALPLGAALGIIRTVQVTLDRLRHPETLAAEPELLPGG